jgi:N-acetylglutamate synthase-like GNAT family acetyltransferase
MIHISTRLALPRDAENVRSFYRENGYTQALSPGDTVLLGERQGSVCAALRRCLEQGMLVLRGMRVAEGIRRQGVGTILLQSAIPHIGGRDGYCIPHRHLRTFYGRIGFSPIEACQAPAFLRDRLECYCGEHDLDVILMRRPGSTGP